MAHPSPPLCSPRLCGRSGAWKLSGDGARPPGQALFPSHPKCSTSISATAVPTPSVPLRRAGGGWMWNGCARRVALVKRPVGGGIAWYVSAAAAGRTSTLWTCKEARVKCLGTGN